MIVNLDRVQERKKKVLLVSLHYHPEPNFITADLADHISRKGNMVTVITAHPSYPLGRFYDSVKTLLPQKTVENGVVVWRLPVVPDHSKSKWRRAAYYLSFSGMAFVWSFFIALMQDHVVVYQTPFTTAASVIWRKFFGSKITYIVCDLWPESFPASGIKLPSWLYSWMTEYSKFINLFADRIITSTNGIRIRFINDGISPSKVNFFPVWVDGLPDELTSSQAPNDLKPTIDIVYAGNLGPAQGLEVLILAADILRKQPHIQFHIYGSGSEEENLRDLSQKLQTSSVHFHGRVDPRTAFSRLQSASLVFLHLKKSTLFHMTLPSKLASLLASGKIILCGAEGETSQMIESNNSGFIFEPENPNSLAMVILNATNTTQAKQTRMVENAQSLYKRLFSKKVLLEYYYNSIMTDEDSTMQNMRESQI